MIRAREQQAISRCRKQVRALQSEREALEANLLSREPLVEGSLVTIRKVCGKAGCRCATSKRMRHGPFLSLSILRRGQTRRIHLPKPWEEQVRAGVEKARRYRKAHQQWRDLERRMGVLWKQVERYRKHVPYEPKQKGR
ncbi:MAG: DUF6788 family protein [Desulfobaccales bacterium]